MQIMYIAHYNTPAHFAVESYLRGKVVEVNDDDQSDWRNLQTLQAILCHSIIVRSPQQF